MVNKHSKTQYPIPEAHSETVIKSGEKSCGRSKVLNQVDGQEEKGERTHLLSSTGPFPNDFIHNNPKYIPEQGFCSHGVPVKGEEWLGVSHQDKIYEQSRSS